MKWTQTYKLTINGTKPYEASMASFADMLQLLAIIIQLIKKAKSAEANSSHPFLERSPRNQINHQ